MVNINFQPDTSAVPSGVTVQVNVKDGKLTVDAIEGSNTKINYIHLSE